MQFLDEFEPKYWNLGDSSEKLHLLNLFRNCEIQLPKGSHVSQQCKDLLTSLLKHDPNERISFDDFFAHDFLDLAHTPTKESYDKAVGLVQRAVKMDTDKNPKEAFHLYCEALRYFIPILTSKGQRSELFISSIW